MKVQDEYQIRVTFESELWVHLTEAARHHGSWYFAFNDPKLGPVKGWFFVDFVTTDLAGSTGAESIFRLREAGGRIDPPRETSVDHLA